jgi:hypothetical protein
MVFDRQRRAVAGAVTPKPVALGDLDHREPVPDDLHNGVEALLCHSELWEHAPHLLASTKVGEAEEGQAVVSTINRKSGTHQPVSTGQASTGPAQLREPLACNGCSGIPGPPQLPTL